MPDLLDGGNRGLIIMNIMLHYNWKPKIKILHIQNGGRPPSGIL